MAAMPRVAAGSEGPERRSEAPSFAPTLVGKPYRDLRRHTAGELGEVSGLDVSPDGTKVLYSSLEDGPSPNLYLKELNGASVIRKTSGRARDIHPRFSPDGKWIAFASNREGNFDVWIIPAIGAGGMEQVTSSSDDEVHPAWSPDGRKIALSRTTPNHGSNLWILDRGDQSVVELGPGLFPDWSPTGEWIAFQKPSERPPYWHGIWIIRPDGSEVRQVLASADFGAVDASWSPDGSLLGFVAVKRGTGDAQKTGTGQIWVVEVARGKLYQISEGPDDGAPAWGLDGRIYFSSHRLGVRGIWSLVPPEVEG
jgi:Tol biopolymer transport system component